MKLITNNPQVRYRLNLREGGGLLHKWICFYNKNGMFEDNISFDKFKTAVTKIENYKID